jgi:hypothetical protein
MVAAAALIAFARPPSSHSQQAAAGEYLWGVVPKGVLSDMRLQDGLGQLVDPQAVSREAGSNAQLRYDGGGVNAPQATTKLDAIRMLFAAAGFNDPATQLREARPCRVWVVTPYANSPEELPLSAALGRVIASSAATIGITMQPCVQAPSLADADFVLWASTQQPPISVNARGVPQAGDSFLVATDRPQPTGPVFRPPVTGDGGLIGPVELKT